MLRNYAWNALLIIVCSVLYMFQSWFSMPMFPDEKLSKLLTIGILSSRSNFVHRLALRQTWLNVSSHLGMDIHYKFIVGKRNCQIPTNDRLDFKDCQPWNISLDDISRTEKFAFHVNLLSKHLPSSKPYDTFTILVLHPIIITKIGILNRVYPAHVDYSVALIDAAVETEIISAKFMRDKPGVLSEGYRYVPIDPLILPKGFEVMLKIQVTDFDIESVELEHISIDTGKLFLITQMSRSSDNAVTKPSNKTVSSVSFGFSAYDLGLLREHARTQEERQIKWNLILERESTQLKQEMLKYKDILLVDVVDVYRNLPRKTLLFYDWVAKHMSTDYVLKTDDDTFINLNSVAEALLKIVEQQPEKLWWSSFRYNWLVDRVGKWREHEYNSIVYPPFGCGAGNVLSMDLVQWLSKNKDNLHFYQGEDISVGIWLSAVSPKYLDDSRWICNNKCLSENFNVGEQNPDEIKQMAKDLQLCNNPCGCTNKNLKG